MGLGDEPTINGFHDWRCANCGQPSNCQGHYLSSIEDFYCSKPGDPVVFDIATRKWYFYDETWSDWLGPYDSRKEARESCEAYAKSLGCGHT